MNGRSRLATLSVAAFMLVSTVVAAAFSHVRVPSLSFLGPCANAVTILEDIATAIVLAATVRVRWSSAHLILAGAFAAGAGMLVPILLAQSYAPDAAPVLTTPAAFSGWLFVNWHVGAALFGIGYALVRRSSVRTRRFTRRRAVAIVASASGASLVAAIGLAWAFGALAIGDPHAGTLAVPVVVLLAASTIAVWSVGTRRTERAFAVTLLAMGCAYALEAFTGFNGSIAANVAALLYAAASVLVLVVAVSDLIDASRRLGQTEEALAEHTQRLAALWEIAADSSLDEGTLFVAMLEAGARAVRPGHAFAGHIARLDGEDVVIETVVRPPAGPADGEPLADVAAGTRFPLRDSLHAEIVAGGATAHWADVLADPAAQRRRHARTLALRAAIGTTFRVDATPYFLLFGSQQPLDRAFSREDRIFVDVLASFFAARVHQRNQRERIRHQAEVDALTGLFNRSAFRSSVSQALREAARSNSGGVLAIVDLDRFVEINDTYGHLAGDRVLIGVADALRAVDPRICVGRLGGDTFGAFVPEVDDLDRAESVIRAIASTYAGPIGTSLSGEPITVRATLGAARFPSDARTYEELLARAEAALQGAKRNGSPTAFYSRDLESALDVRRTMRRELASAIAANNLVVQYQPTIVLANGRPAGAEALVRWCHPTRGLIGPDDFIPFAEEHGLIGAIGSWVLERVAADITSLGSGLGNGRIYVNLSLHQVDDASLIAGLEQLIAKQPDLVEKLGFEVTESAAMRDTSRTLRLLSAIRSYGIPIALDDFGTGYSSLAQLKRLPVDAIKIDRTFVAGLPGDGHDATLIETQLTIARQFGYETIAEGVEREDQLAWLRALGCRYAQGFVIARPLWLDDFSAWLAAAERLVS